MEFEKQALTKKVAREMRAATRRTEFEGHRFAYTDLKELWATADGEHVLCTHEHDTSWQYWHKYPDGSCVPVVVCASRDEAEQEAINRLIPPTEDDLSSTVGVYLKARFSPTSKWIVVRITGEKTLDELTGIYSRLGCTEIITEQVA